MAAAAARRSHAPRAVAPRLHGVPRRSRRRACARCAAEPARHRARSPCTAARLTDCLTLRDAMRGIESVRRDRDGPGRAGDAGSARGSSDRCGRTAARRRPGSLGRRDLLDTLSRPADDARRRRSTRSPARRSRIRRRRRCTTRRSRRSGSTRCTCRSRRPTPTSFSRVAEALGVAGASITAPLKPALLDARRRRSTTCQRADRRREHAPARRAGWEGRNFDVAGFLAPLERRGIAADRAARGGARRRRRGARGRVGPARARRARRDRARRRREAATRSPRASASAVATGRRVRLGSARQHDAGRHLAGRGRVADRRAIACAGRSSTTWSTTRSRPRCCDGRAQRARETIGGLEMLVGAGVPAVRVVDRACTAPARASIERGALERVPADSEASAAT